MGRRIFFSGRITNDQIKAIYAAAEKIGVTVAPWQDHLGTDRAWFKWAISGGPLAVRRMIKFLKTLPLP